MSTETERAGFMDLLGEMQLSEFFDSYWLKRPVILQPKIFPDVLQISAQDVLQWYLRDGRTDQRFTTFNNLFQTRTEGRVRLEEALAKDTEAHAHLSELATREAFIVRDLTELPQFRDYCAEIMKFWRSRCSLNCYMIRTGADHFPVHQDGHHIFAIQTHGHKRWYLYPPSIPLPMSCYKRRKESVDLNDAAIFEVHEGQVLYIPTGWRHHAETVSEVSIHFSLGLHPLRWVDLLKDLSELAGAHHSPLRDYVPFTVTETGIEYHQNLAKEASARMELIGRDLASYTEMAIGYHNTNNLIERSKG